MSIKFILVLIHIILKYIGDKFIMNIKSLKKEAWLLHNDILLKGVVKRKWFKYIFIPNEDDFGYKIIRKKDIGYILFYNDYHIVMSGLGHLERIS